MYLKYVLEANSVKAQCQSSGQRASHKAVPAHAKAHQETAFEAQQGIIQASSSAFSSSSIRRNHRGRQQSN